MEVILTQDVDHLGTAGELVTVKPGYGRNYLLPQGLAVLATTRNKNRLEHERAVIASRIEKQRAEAGSIAQRLNAMTLQFQRKVGEDEKLFGSVTSRDIAEQLEVAGIKIDHRKIEMPDAVKALGKYEVPVKCGAGVKADLKFWVVAEDA